ncbi:TlpA family protein disulfide reductase [candidate division KSB1 bacterium]|nr:TlpA family protein disulfide reductase [candidate division KSB1 bacterium]
MSKKIMLAVLTILLIATCLWSMRQKVYQFIVTSHVNEALSGFALMDLQGHAIRSSEFEDKVLFLDFWSTWCGACLQSFPEFQSVYENYRANPNVVFLAVNMGQDGDTPEKVREFINVHRYTFPVAYDEGSKLTDRYEVKYLPTVLIVDQAGTIRLRHIGYSKTLENYSLLLSKHIDELLNHGPDKPESNKKNAHKDGQHQN